MNRLIKGYLMKRVIQQFVRLIFWGSLVIAASLLFSWYLDYGNPRIAFILFVMCFALFHIIRALREALYAHRMRNGKRGR